MPKEPKAAQKHHLTAYNRDNQMLLRRKKARATQLLLHRTAQRLPWHTDEGEGTSRRLNSIKRSTLCAYITEL